MKMSSDFVGGSNCPCEDAFFITRRELVYSAYVKLPARISRAASCRSFQLHNLRFLSRSMLRSFDSVAVAALLVFRWMVLNTLEEINNLFSKRLPMSLRNQRLLRQ
jgi:hypothetical protein